MSGGTRRVRLDEAVRALATRRPLVIGVDFDGTLAPIVDQPHQARADPRALDALAHMAQRPDVSVAIVSGRARRDLENLVGELPDVVLVAEHGNDMGAELAPHQDVERLAHDLTHLARSLPGSMVEAKRSSVVFHYRNANATDLDQHLSKVLDLATRWPAATVIAGKKVIELSLGTRTKGDAISELATEAAGVLYIGDDTTDETVFESLGPDDIGVKVGKGETAAGFRVQGVEDVVDLLVTLEKSIEDG